MISISDPGTRAFTKAREIFDAGAHFLLGTRGETMDTTKPLGIALVPAVLDPRAPIVGAGRGMTKGKKTLICGGRPRHPDVLRASGLRPSFGRMRTVGGVGKRTTQEMKDYIQHLKMLRDFFNMPQEAWSPFKMNDRIALTPRTFFREDGTAAVFLGEDCAGRIHVDCIGLVNLCRRAAGATGAQYSIKQIEKAIHSMSEPVFERLDTTGTRSTPGRAAVHDGDIVIKHENHIGICGITKSGDIEVIEATGSAEGIIKTRFKNARSLDSGKWRTRVRAF